MHYSNLQKGELNETGPLHVILVRHGQSINNVVEAEVGDTPEFYARRSTDPTLSALGHQQATLLGSRLGEQLREMAAAGKVQLTCSTMQRALQTAYPLAMALRQSVQVNPELVERHGFFRSTDVSSTGAKAARIPVAGPDREGIAKRFPSYDVALVPRLAEAMAEDEAMAEERAGRGAAALHAEAYHDGAERIVVIVSHCDFLGHLARALLTLNPRAADQIPSYFDLNNCATVHIALMRGGGGGKAAGKAKMGTAGGARLLHWNRTDHLAELLRSGIAWRNVTGQGATWARHGEGGTGMPPSYAESKVVETQFSRAIRGGAPSGSSMLSGGGCWGRSRADWLKVFLIWVLGMFMGAMTAFALTGEFGGPRIIAM